VQQAAAYLMKTFDIGGPDSNQPDGVWHYPELAAYVNSSRRPEGEELALTASNMMLLMDHDRSSSIDQVELEIFIDELRDRRGLNGEAGLKREGAREAKRQMELAEGGGSTVQQGEDGKTWMLNQRAQEKRPQEPAELINAAERRRREASKLGKSVGREARKAKSQANELERPAASKKKSSRQQAAGKKKRRKEKKSSRWKGTLAKQRRAKRTSWGRYKDEV